MSSLPTSPNRASHRRVGNGFEGDGTRRRTRFFDSASTFAEDGYGGRAAPAQNYPLCRITGVSYRWWCLQWNLIM